MLGKVSSPIGAVGTGEMIFSQAGAAARRRRAAKTESAIPKGTEVVVTRYEGGVAYVRPWEELQRVDERVKSRGEHNMSITNQIFVIRL